MEQQKTITLSLNDYDPAAGKVKSDLPDEHARIEDSNFSVQFQMLYEVHGDHQAASSTNDASLLVIKMIPFSHDRKEHMVSFHVTLTVLPDKQHDSEIDWSEAPTITTYEPNSGGAQYVKIRTTNETLEQAFEGAVQLEGFGVSPGIKGSRTRKTEYEKDHVLQIGSGSRRTGHIPLRKSNTVWWRIQAADIKDSGIGDSFTVALLIRRAPASSFQLQATVDSEIGNFVEKLKHFVPSGLRSHKPPTIIGTYGPEIDKESHKAPPGIDKHNLGAASRDNFIKRLKEIGLHLPEEARLADFGDAASSRAPEKDKPAVSNALARVDDSTEEPPRRPRAQHESDFTRMQRHRRMAALYERLAELHREEARQYLSQDEVAYAHQVEDEWEG
ncbi:hypothetical protein PISL3812_00784 [Talaromyces islandicus]|uniref:Uncharacterized protein n=1 Tax=Talaromyces islandicus TaxID=28573 RepID=A0A0U1LKC5_TALIS|nr:hypothetical protein PISL3812_00784 [Talaromyces islandicus]